MQLHKDARGIGRPVAAFDMILGWPPLRFSQSCQEGRRRHAKTEPSRKITFMTNWDIAFRGLPGIGLVNPGDDLAAITVKAAEADGFAFADHDVVVVAQKVVSKAENRIVDLASVNPSARALKLAERTGRDARLCQLYLDESKAILNVKGRHVVTVDNRGFQGTGAGVDMSNVGPRSEGRAVLLPVDPDASARRIRDGVRQRTGTTVAVIVSDSFGSDNRDGAFGAAIGIAGIRHMEEPDGEQDLFGNPSRPIMNRGRRDRLRCVDSHGPDRRRPTGHRRPRHHLHRRRRRIPGPPPRRPPAAGRRLRPAAGLLSPAPSLTSGVHLWALHLRQPWTRRRRPERRSLRA